MPRAIIFIALSCLSGFACTGQHTDSAHAVGEHADKSAEHAVDEHKDTEPPMPTSSTEVPDELLREMTEYVMQETGLKADQITLDRAEKVAWRDGSMGCPQPNLMYTQAIVEGFWVIMIANNEEYDFRATKIGKFQRCQGQTKQAPIKYDDT